MISPLIFANMASRVLGAVSVKKFRLICLYPFRTTSQMMTTNGTAVKAENRQTSQKNILSLALRQPE